MSFFKRSSETGKSVRDKILIYGPTHTSKTHQALTWPDPALVDVENRAAQFADRVDFFHAQPKTMDDINGILDELKRGSTNCATFIIDSYSTIFEKLRVAHTSLTQPDAQGKRTAIIDNVSVNRRIAPVREFIFSVFEHYLIVIAHAQQKYDFAGKENLRARDRLEFLGDDKFRFSFDFVFRTQMQGNDPRQCPVKFIVEKSASPHVNVGDEWTVRPNERLFDVFMARTKRAPPPPAGFAARPSQHVPEHKPEPQRSEPAKRPEEDPTNQPITVKQLREIGELQTRAKMNSGDLSIVIMGVTQNQVQSKNDLNAAEGDRVIAILHERVKAAAS